MLKNPVKSIRKEIGISRTDLANQLELHYTTLYNIEKGRTETINKKVLTFFEKEGYNINNVKQKYKQYKKKKQEKALKDFRGY